MSKMVVCPECGGKFSVKDGTATCFCSFCGAKIDLTSEPKDTTEDIDEESEEFEADGGEEDERQDDSGTAFYPHMAQLYNADKAKGRGLKEKLILGSGIAAVILILIIVIAAVSRRKPAHEGEAQAPASALSFSEKNYEDVAIQLHQSGFTDITLKGEGDLITGWLTSENSVDSVSINGVDNFSSGRWFPADARVVIRYHSFYKEEFAYGEEPSADATDTSVESSDSSGEESNISSLEVDPTVVIPKAPQGEMDGFDESANFDFEFHGVTFSIPSYYVDWDDVGGGFEKGFYVKGDDPCGLAFIASDIENLDANWKSLTRSQSNALLDSGMESAISGYKETFKDAKTAGYDRTEVNGMPIAIITLDGDGYYSQLAAIVCPDINEMVIAEIEIDDDSQHSYLADFGKILSSVKYSDTENSADTSASETVAAETSEKNSAEKTVTEAEKEGNVKESSDSAEKASTEVSKAASSEKTENKGDTKKTEEKSEDADAASSMTMPILAGRSISDITSQAAEFGLSEQYDDDFGHGTHYKTYVDTSGGLMLNAVYSTSTNEILMASIVTNNLASASEQKSFIKGMAGVMCPSGDSNAVSKWVSANAGGTASTTINGVEYQLSLGPVGNLLFDAGYNAWEEWDLQFQ